MEDVDDPTDFKDPRLQKLDHEFRCAICKELFTTPVQLTTCVHSFCSICIRRRLTQERHCPTCRTPADESKLIRNSVLDDCVNTWRSTVRQLIIHMQNAPPSITSASSTPQQLQEPPPAASAIRHHLPEDPLLNGRRSQRIQQKQQQKQPLHIPTTPIVMNNDDLDDFIPAASIKYNATTTPSPQKDTPTRPEVIDLTEESNVNCPICSQAMKQSVINAHLDRCMRGDSSFIPSPRASSSSSSRTVGSSSFAMTVSPNRTTLQHAPGKKPVKLVYDMLKLKDLQKIMKDLELPDWGDKQLLVWRHKEYVTLYHANKDAARPMSGTELRRQLAELENAHNNGHRGQKLSANMDEHNRVYKDQFDLLIEETKRRRQSRINKAPSEAENSQASRDQ